MESGLPYVVGLSLPDSETDLSALVGLANRTINSQAMKELNQVAKSRHKLNPSNLGQLIVATRPQACPYVKVLAAKDFPKNTVDAYLNYAYAMWVSGRIEKDKFVKILCTAAESCVIYAICERKEGNPIWTGRIDLQDWVESKRAADNLLWKCMEREKNEIFSS